MFLKKITVGICASVLTAGMASAADLSGKTVEWTIPFSETGGSAKWANFFAPLLSEALPGNPTVVVKYMPGAGSTKGANWFQQQKNGDGTVIFGSSGSTQFPYLLDDPRVRYEYNDWNAVMASGTGGVAYLNAEDGKLFDGSANKLKGKKFVYGNQGATRLDLIPEETMFCYPPSSLWEEKKELYPGIRPELIDLLLDDPLLDRPGLKKGY